MAIDSLSCESYVPTKNTFIHFGGELPQADLMPRTASCPSIMTELELAEQASQPASPRDSPKMSSRALLKLNSFRTTTSFEGEDDIDTCSPSTMSGDSQDAVDSLCSGMTTRNNSPLNLGSVPGLAQHVASRPVSPVHPGPVPSMSPAQMPSENATTPCRSATQPFSSGMASVATVPAQALVPGMVIQVVPRVSPFSGPGVQAKKVQAPKKQSASAMQKRINKELTLAGKRRSSDVLVVVSKHLGQMNGVNLATAFHRLARSEQPDVVAHAIFRGMLDEAERAIQDGTMPANCCTIIAWSCAQLRVFRPRLFAALATTATPQLCSCQAYEVTNLLWAFAEFYKYDQDQAAMLARELQGLLDAVAEVFMSRHPGDFKVQVLTSALISVSALPWSQSCAQTWLFSSTLHELVSRWGELEQQGQGQVGAALERLRVKCRQLFENCFASVTQKFPSVAPQVFERWMAGGR